MKTVPSNKVYYGLCAVLFTAATTFLFGLFCPTPLMAETRNPNSLERTYTALVTHGYSANICNKISPKALSRSLFNSRGTQIYYQRSACYFYVAAAELNATYCSNVIEAQAWFNDGSMFSPESCREVVTKGKPRRATIGFANHEELLRAAGFDDEDLFKAVSDSEPGMTWMDFYYFLKRKDEAQLQQKFNQLPDFSDE